MAKYHHGSILSIGRSTRRRSGSMGSNPPPPFTTWRGIFRRSCQTRMSRLLHGEGALCWHVGSAPLLVQATVGAAERRGSRSM